MTQHSLALICNSLAGASLFNTPKGAANISSCIFVSTVLRITVCTFHRLPCRARRRRTSMRRWARGEAELLAAERLPPLGWRPSYTECYI